jgi:hypothetical protein
VSAERAAAKTNSRSEGIILQKRVEKKSNWIFRNLGKNV